MRNLELEVFALLWKPRSKPKLIKLIAKYTPRSPKDIETTIDSMLEKGWIHRDKNSNLYNKYWSKVHHNKKFGRSCL